MNEELTIEQDCHRRACGKTTAGAQYHDDEIEYPVGWVTITQYKQGPVIEETICFCSWGCMRQWLAEGEMSWKAQGAAMGNET